MKMKGEKQQQHLTATNMVVVSEKETAKHTLRCLLGCNIGEGIGAAIGFMLGMDMTST
jgi:hypothetical protein